MLEFGALTLHDISTKRIDAFTAKLIGKGRSPKTVRNILGVLSRCLRSAVEWGDLERVPPMGKPKVPPPDFDWLNREESLQLLRAARDSVDYVSLLFALDTGCRAGEQLAMRWGQIDHTQGKVLVRRAVWQGKEGTTKTHKFREIPLTRRLDKALRKHKHLRGPYVFCNDDGRPLTINQLEYILTRTARRAGLRDVTWQNLRHSFASQLVSGGVSLRVVQELLGHTDIRTTMRYAHLGPGLRRDAVSVLEQDPGGGHHLGTDPEEHASLPTWRSREPIEIVGQ